jgi:hypothetical protein
MPPFFYYSNRHRSRRIRLVLAAYHHRHHQRPKGNMRCSRGLLRPQAVRDRVGSQIPPEAPQACPVSEVHSVTSISHFGTTAVRRKLSIHAFQGELGCLSLNWD